MGEGGMARRSGHHLSLLMIEGRPRLSTGPEVLRSPGMSSRRANPHHLGIDRSGRGVHFTANRRCIDQVGPEASGGGGVRSATIDHDPPGSGSGILEEEEEEEEETWRRDVGWPSGRRA